MFSSVKDILANMYPENQEPSETPNSDKAEEETKGGKTRE